MNLPKFRDFQTDKAMTCKMIEYMQLHLTCNKSILGMLYLAMSQHCSMRDIT